MKYTYTITKNPKMLRETLCIAQNAISHSVHNRARLPWDSDTLQELIDACDVMRPLGPDGKHGDRHTPFCGCEDIERLHFRDWFGFRLCYGSLVPSQVESSIVLTEDPEKVTCYRCYIILEEKNR